MLSISVGPGEELMEVLARRLAERGVSQAAIVSLVGAVDSCCISNMPKGDARRDVLTRYTEPLELSGMGEVHDGKPHIHCVLSAEGDRVVGGHLHWARIENWFVNAYVLPA
jgi:predicted DNA-binding protein with PD1-like motif